ncbi:MAG: hypothetical protein ACK42A_07050 [Pyrinomonadaceae bacterium]
MKLIRRVLSAVPVEDSIMELLGVSDVFIILRRQGSGTTKTLSPYPVIVTIPYIHLPKTACTQQAVFIF